MKQKQILKFHTWNVFYRQNFFTLEKIRQIFRNFTWNYFKKIPSKISERFFRRNVQFSPFHTWNKIFWMFLWSVSHTHTKKIINSPQIFFPLTWRKKKYLHFCCHSKLFSWGKKKFFSLSLTLEKTRFSWKCVYTRFHKRGNKIQSHMKEKKSPENSPDCFLLLGFTHKKISPENNFKLKKPPKVKFLKITHKINSNEKHFQSGSHMET